MFKKRNQRDMTPKERANRAQMSTLLRFIACGYLVYIMYQLFKMARAGDETLSRTVAMVVSVIFMLLGIVIIVLTIINFIRSYKRGMYTEAGYANDYDDGEDDEDDDEDYGEDEDDIPSIGSGEELEADEDLDSAEDNEE